jgi:ATP-dependent protease ClpP protease subunit
MVLVSNRSKKSMMTSKKINSELLSLIHDYGINISRRELFLFPHDENCSINCLIAARIVKNIHLLNSISYDPILIHIGITGGDWDYSFMIYDAISLSPSKVITISYADVGSTCSIIPQAADLRIISPHAEFMIHEGNITYDGTTKGAKYNIAWNNRSHTTMLQIYANRCQEASYFEDWSQKKIIDFLQERIDKTEDWFMTPQDAVKYGFMDGVLGEKGFENIETILK